MKQRIRKGQLDSLTEPQLNRLAELLGIPKGTYSDEKVWRKRIIAKCDIGQMIEILLEEDECLTITHMMTYIDGQTVWGWEVYLRHLKKWFNAVEHVDALFEAVKSILRG